MNIKLHWTQGKLWHSDAAGFASIFQNSKGKFSNEQRDIVDRTKRHKMNTPTVWHLDFIFA